MPKTNITTLVTALCTVNILALVALTAGPENQASAQNKSFTRPQGQPENNLPQTTKLEQNDNLDPTVNRTQAMRTEAETGSLAPITGTRTTTARPKAPTPTRPIKRKKVLHEY